MENGFDETEKNQPEQAANIVVPFPQHNRVRSVKEVQALTTAQYEESTALTAPELTLDKLPAVISGRKQKPMWPYINAIMAVGTVAGVTVGFILGREFPVAPSLTRQNSNSCHVAQQLAEIINKGPSEDEMEGLAQAWQTSANNCYRNVQQRPCRAYAIKTNTDYMFGTACRQPDGTWKPDEGR